MFPIRVSFPAFWYRRKEIYLSELSRSTNNKKNAMKYIKYQASKIKRDIVPIQYPRFKFDIEKFKSQNETIEKTKINNKSNKKNILMFFPWMVIGGADRFNLELIKGLTSKGFNIKIITTEPQINEMRQIMEEYATVYDLTSFLDQTYWLEFIDNIIEKEHIASIFLSNNKFAYFLVKYFKTRYPYLNIYDYIHMNEENKNSSFNLSNMNKEYIDKTFFCNESNRVEFINKFKIDKITSSEKYKTVYIGVDTNVFDKSKFNQSKIFEKYNIHKDKFIISYICRLELQKRPYLMIDIFKEIQKNIKNAILLIVGQGHEKIRMKEYIRKNKLQESIILFDNIEDIQEIYAITDVFVNCSENEGIPLTTYEAIAMQVPIVASNVGGESEVINFDNGFLVDKDCEIKDYIDCIMKIHNHKFKLDNDKRDIFKKKFDLNIMINYFCEEFNKECYLKKHNDNYNDLEMDIIQNILELEEEYNWQIKEFNKRYIDKNKPECYIKTIIIKILKKIYNLIRKILKGGKKE